jgi:hypothetical protein
MRVNIDIDFDVFKALTNRRSSESVTYNDVLREMLGLPSATASPQASGDGWTWKGVTLPNGTELRAEYKGQAYFAKIEGGKWMQNGKPRSSPSAAAYAITQSGINGWWFWSVKRPGDVIWVPLGKLRSE